MRRFFVPVAVLEGVASGDEIALPKEVTHHIKTVLRLTAGTHVVLSDGRGCCCHGSIVSFSSNMALVLVERCWFAAETALPIELLQGLPTGDKFDLVLQKNTELGVGVFQPLVTQRSQFRVPANKLQRKIERWQRITTEAARQSERSWLPQILEPVALKVAVERCSAQLKLVLWERASQPLRVQLPAQRPESVAVLVGPEGGLTGEEAEMAQAYGFIPVALGPRILRTETAGVAIAAVLQFHYGDFDQIAKRDHPGTELQN